MQIPSKILLENRSKTKYSIHNEGQLINRGATSIRWTEQTAWLNKGNTASFINDGILIITDAAKTALLNTMGASIVNKNQIYIARTGTAKNIIYGNGIEDSEKTLVLPVKIRYSYSKKLPMMASIITTKLIS